MANLRSHRLPKPTQGYRRLAPSRLGVLVTGLLLALALSLLVRSSIWSDVSLATWTATVSSSAVGSSADALIDTGSTRSPGRAWVAREGVGAWAQLTFSGPTLVSHIHLVRTTDPDEQIHSGFLSFSDGSSISVMFPQDGSVYGLSFTPRTVDSVRFAVVTLAAGATVAALAEVDLGGKSSALAVSRAATADGNVGPNGHVTASDSTSDPAAVTDGTRDDLGRNWVTATPAPGAWVELAWTRPRELASVSLYGSDAELGSVASGHLRFSDGSTVSVGALTRTEGAPTTVAFMPRVVRSVRFILDATAGSGWVALAEMRAYQIGATAPGPSMSGQYAEPEQPEQSANPSCTPDLARVPSFGELSVLCPAAGGSVRGEVGMQVVAPGATKVTGEVWSSDAIAPAGLPVSTAPDASGRGILNLDFRHFPRGPVTVRLSMSGRGLTSDSVTYLQLYNVSQAFADDGLPRASAAARGRTLVYDEEFDRSVSMSRDGLLADYAAAKPERGRMADFGEASFADPADEQGNVGVVDNRYLQLRVKPAQPGSIDPAGRNLTYTGGLLSSARLGGSGFSSQYGYFETRMTAPPNAGAWPAWWMLPMGSLVAAPEQAAEVDAVELYGHDPLTSCHSTHAYVGGADVPRTTCVKGFEDARTGMGAWHVYGVDIAPAAITYYVDGRQVAQLPQLGGGDQPMFFMVNLALGGGWPIDLGAVGGRIAMYVDYIRVYN